MNKTLYVVMDNVLVGSPSGIANLSPAAAAEFECSLYDVSDIFSPMDPVPNANLSYKNFAQHYDTHILSTVPWGNPTVWIDKLLWMQRHRGKPAYMRLIFGHKKNLDDGDYFIDNRTRNGADRFRSEQVQCGTERFPNWRIVLSYLVR